MWTSQSVELTKTAEEEITAPSSSLKEKKRKSAENTGAGELFDTNQVWTRQRVIQKKKEKKKKGKHQSTTASWQTFRVQQHDGARMWAN